MLILKEEKQSELIVKKSRFIAIARICNSLSDVKSLLDETRHAYPDATHVVHAAVIGNEFSFSDDKEPKGTAGRPALEVLKGSGISNICILIVRYFGGTLLGTGGLVKAYSDSAKQVLDGIHAEEYVELTKFRLTTSYEKYPAEKRMLLSSGVSILSETFNSTVVVTCTCPAGVFPRLQAQLYSSNLEQI